MRYPVYSESEPDLNNELDLSSAETIECIVQQLMTRQKARIKAMEEESDNCKAMSGTPLLTLCRQSSCDTMIDASPSTSSSGRLSHVTKSGKNILMKKDVSGNQNDGQNVRLVQLGTPSTVPTTTTSAMNSSQVNTTSLIFNVSQFQSGNGTVLILNSSVPQTRALQGTGAAENSSITAPVTLVYSRPGESSTIDTTTMTEHRSDPIQMKPTTFQVPAFPSEESHINNQHQYKSSTLNYSTSPANVDATNGNIFDPSNLQASSSQPINMETSFTGNCLLKTSNDSSLSESPSNRSDILHCGTVSNSPFIRSESSGSLVSSQQRNINYNLENKNPCHQLISNSAQSGPNNRYYSSSKLVSTDSDDMNPMDFIDNEITSPDENLFNLEAFEMLTDLPNLEDLNSTSSTNNLFHLQKDNQSTAPNQDFRSSVPQIADYSPDWSYPEGGMKVLVAGPWTSQTLHYNVFFDGMSVPTSLVQNGVLRCFSPAHEPGYVSLQVCIEGNIVSNSVIFEYRDHPATPVSQCTEDYFSIDGKWSANFE